ncbi:MAG: helix-turn-helix transcriptional regulator [Lachnospiraceae bacterium]|nr:helix-turn-helix transcriptional regulator [Lachnospiraceae bacterium]
MDDAYDFGMILQTLRKEHGMTQEQLANKIHKESSIISRYEKNLQSPTFETVRAFAAIFNVSMDYLSGMEKKTSIATYGLTSEQTQMIYDLSETFRLHNNTYKKRLTDEQFILIGKIVAELST